MRDDNYISSKKDIRNRRYKQRRRQVMLNRGIFAGILLIAVLVCIIFGIKSCREDSESEPSATAGTAGNTDENKPDEDQSVQQPSTEGETDTTPKVTGDYKSDAKRIVCVDAGHGGKDGGSVGADGVLEKDDNLKMSIALRSALENLGVTVYMTREDDKWVTKDDRVKLANSVNADLLISIHRNEYAADSSVKGFESWVHSKQPADSTDAATKIQEALVEAGITRNRGVKFGSQGSSTEDYYINNHSIGPSCLMEMGFMTNGEDNNVFRNNTEALANSMAKAIVEWMDAQGL